MRGSRKVASLYLLSVSYHHLKRCLFNTLTRFLLHLCSGRSEYEGHLFFNPYWDHGHMCQCTKDLAQSCGFLSEARRFVGNWQCDGQFRWVSARGHQHYSYTSIQSQQLWIHEPGHLKWFVQGSHVCCNELSFWWVSFRWYYTCWKGYVLIDGKVLRLRLGCLQTGLEDS